MFNRTVFYQFLQLLIIKTPEVRGSTSIERVDTITNTLPKLTVNKVDSTGYYQLAGAEFSLLREDRETAVKKYERIISTNDTKGNLLKEIQLTTGTYYLKETKAPEGFNLPEYMWKITVSDKGITMQTDNGESSIKYQAKMDGPTYTFTIENTPGVELPETGGTGTGLFTLLGSVLMLGSCMLLIRRKRTLTGI